MSSHNRRQFFNRVYRQLPAAQQQKQQQLEDDEVASLLHLASFNTSCIMQVRRKIVAHVKTVFICSLKNRLVLADGPRLILQYQNLSCIVHSGLPRSDILYWCESPTGGRSEVLNITTTITQFNFHSAPLHLFYCYKVAESSLYLTLALFPCQLILTGWGRALITSRCKITQSECFPL